MEGQETNTYIRRHKFVLVSEFMGDLLILVVLLVGIYFVFNAVLGENPTLLYLLILGWFALVVLSGFWSWKSVEYYAAPGKVIIKSGRTRKRITTFEVTGELTTEVGQSFIEKRLGVGSVRFIPRYGSAERAFNLRYIYDPEKIFSIIKGIELDGMSLKHTKSSKDAVEGAPQNKPKDETTSKPVVPYDEVVAEEELV